MTTLHEWAAWAPAGEVERAERVLRAIACALPPPGTAGLGAGLGRGEAGLALFFGYLGLATDEPGATTRAAQHLERALDSGEPASRLMVDRLGAGWVAAHLGLAHEALATVDDELAATLMARESSGDFELLEGLVGQGLYALERGRNGRGRELLERVLTALAEAIENGRLAGADPGMAHGTAAVIGWLARVLVERPEHGLAGNCLHELLVTAIEAGETALDMSQPRDVAWCTGGLGSAVALFTGGRAVGQPDWLEVALDRAREFSRISCQDAGVPDVGLCHGCAGVAHLFRRLGIAAQDPDLLAAADRWLTAVLDRRKNASFGVGGYARWTRNGWRPAAGFLGGAAGIGLALLAAITPVAPDWDRLLLLSGATGGGS